MIFIYQVLHQSQSSFLELLFLLLNAICYFGLSRTVLLQHFPQESVAAVTLFLAAFYTGHLWVLIQKGKKDRGLTVAFTALASFFLTLTLPMLFSNSWLTVSWSVLAMIFYGSAAKLNSRFLRNVSLCLYAWVAIRVFALDLPASYQNPFLEVTWTAVLERLTVFGTILFSMAMALRWIRIPPVATSNGISTENDTPYAPSRQASSWSFGIVLFLLSFSVIQLEFYRTVSFLFAPIYPVMNTLGWVTGGLILLWLAQNRSSSPLRTCLLIFTSLAVFKILFIDLSGLGLNLFALRFDLPNGWHALDTGMRLLNFGLMLGYLFVLYTVFQKQPSEKTLRNLFGYGALAMWLLYSSLELTTLLDTFVPGFRGGGLSVYWGLFALTIVSTGLLKRVRPLRMVGLAMFSLVAAKVFFSDLSQLDPVYRIVAFIVLGIVLIAGAFAYVKCEDLFKTGESE